MAPPVNSALVTGAAGFVGRWLCADLTQRGVSVRALDLAGAEGPWDRFYAIDLTQVDDLRPAVDGVDAVFHLAGLAHTSLAGARGAAAYRALNVEATRRLVGAAVAAGVPRFVLLSSVKAVGEAAAGVLTDESPPQPTTDYGCTKREAETIVLAAAAASGLHAAVLRSALIYGPGVKGNLREMIDAVAAGRFPPLAETGNRRSLVDVRDVAAALWLVATEPAANGRAYILTDGQVYSTRRILEAIRRGLGRRPPRWALGPALLKPVAVMGDGLSRLIGRDAPYSSERHERLFGSAEYGGAAIARELGFRPRWVLETAARELVAGQAPTGPVSR
ncbi:MAG: NAD-dependent epimerase/dehydratase family protein [Candidatus Krumholzibacteria bacterium]|jgi:nucleoside-diphosphate-sugar epimerase|nr:NAD-dependent epimerase/dehydratase family protein [Candidatus Krumholzibacteria bacterium]